MSLGTATLAGLLLVLGQAPTDVVPFSQRSFKIPIDLNDATRASELREMLLFVSTDQGNTWPEEQRVPSGEKAFVFRAPRDGEYWFRVASINNQGRQEPENIFSAAKTVKVLVDTLRPLVRIVSAQRQGDEILVVWEIQEDHPDLASLKLEYHWPDSVPGTWLPATASAVLSGQARIPMHNNNPVSLRLQMKDTAGNVSTAQAEVPGSGITTTAFTPEQSAQPTLAAAGPASAPPPAPVSPREPIPAPAPVHPERQPVPDNVSWSSPAGGAPAVPPPAVVPSTRPPPVSSSVAEAPGLPAFPAAAAPAPVNPMYAPQPPRRQLPALQIVNSPKLTMDYELAQVGPSGVGNVVLYITLDDGKTWQQFAEDPEATNTLRGGKYKRTVELPGEGVYGFRLLVLSRGGRGEPPPRPGDLPEMRVEVDTTRPEAELLDPVPDPQRRDAVVLSWIARDRNLTANPITLEWSESAEGQWHMIATALANAPAHYSWQPPTGMPPNVYLRLRVRDSAGNEAAYVPPEAKLVDVSHPVGRLLSVSVISHQD